MRTLSEAKAAGSTAPLAPRLNGSQLLVLEVVPLEKGSAEEAGELKGDATGSCGGKQPAMSGAAVGRDCLRKDETRSVL